MATRFRAHTAGALPVVVYLVSRGVEHSLRLGGALFVVSEYDDGDVHLGPEKTDRAFGQL